MRVTSPAFDHDQPIPVRYTADGNNVSPPLKVDQVPQGTKELAVIVEDPDAPKPTPFVHWLLYKIPGSVRELPEAIPAVKQLANPKGAMEGQNDMKTIGYTGPAPPKGHGIHHYHFRVYALDQPLQLQPALDEQSVIASMSGHVLESAELVGTYQRP